MSGDGSGPQIHVPDTGRRLAVSLAHNNCEEFKVRLQFRLKPSRCLQEHKPHLPVFVERLKVRRAEKHDPLEGYTRDLGPPQESADERTDLRVAR